MRFWVTLLLGWVVCSFLQLKRVAVGRGAGQVRSPWSPRPEGHGPMPRHCRPPQAGEGALDRRCSRHSPAVGAGGVGGRGAGGQWAGLWGAGWVAVGCGGVAGGAAVGIRLSARLTRGFVPGAGAADGHCSRGTSVPLAGGP